MKFPPIIELVLKINTAKQQQTPLDIEKGFVLLYVILLQFTTTMKAKLEEKAHLASRVFLVISYFKIEIASPIVFSKASLPYLSTSALSFGP